ncbi:ATP-binding protein [Mesorhizobium sp. CA8]|nr:ATP-binding protein [Mesorhizobium sp. CA8]
MDGALRTRKVISEQRRYCEAKARDRNLNLFVPEAFIRGIRHIGYKSNLEALSELVDNSIQAYSERVDLLFNFASEGSTARPTQLAVVDDGHGMAPAMLRFAMMWGGTHRENDREGLGRFGYGLPCATVSMGRRFSIYSKVERGATHVVTLDLDLLDNDAYRNNDGELEIPPARRAHLPDFVSNALAQSHPGGWKSGTVVVIDKLDRLDWTTAAGLRRNLVRHFGVAYHKLLRATSIYIDGERVRPIDPLFLSPDAELFGLDEDHAHALDSVTMTIDGELGDARGSVTLRYAWLPPSFGAIDKSRDAIGINANSRFPILKHYHGIIFSRNGRIVDIQSRTPWTTFINNDRYIRVEIEFSAGLDEAFGVTTAKQQVSLSREMWDLLRAAGLPKAIEHLRQKVRSAKADRTTASRPAVASTSTSVVASPSSTKSHAIEPASPLDVKVLTGRILREFAPEAALDALLAKILVRIRLGRAEHAADYDSLLREWASDMRAGHLPLPAGAEAPKVTVKTRGRS